MSHGTGDNGNGRRLAVTKARRTNALDHGGVSALCLVEGLPARCGDTNSDKEVARSLRSQSSLFIQRRCRTRQTLARITLFGGCVLIRRLALIRLRPYLGRGRLEAKTACVFLSQTTNTDIRMKPGYTDACWVSILLMVTVSFIRTRTRTSLFQDMVLFPPQGVHVTHVRQGTTR